MDIDFRQVFHTIDLDGIVTADRELRGLSLVHSHGFAVPFFSVAYSYFPLRRPGLTSALHLNGEAIEFFGQMKTNAEHYIKDQLDDNANADIRLFNDLVLLPKAIGEKPCQYLETPTFFYLGISCDSSYPDDDPYTVDFLGDLILTKGLELGRIPCWFGTNYNFHRAKSLMRSSGNLKGESESRVVKENSEFGEHLKKLCAKVGTG